MSEKRTGQAESAFEQQVKKELHRSGEPGAIGVCWTVVLAEKSGGTHTSNHQSIWGSPLRELPSDEKLQAGAAALAHTPLQMRAMHQMLLPFYEGQLRTRTKAELAAALGVDEETLERELAPLVARKTVRQFQTASGEAAYELKRADLFLLQLTFAG
jgi:hypothetical protein